MRTSRKTAFDNCNGIALVELLVAIAIIAILIALLLPAIQRKREDYAAEKATQNLRALLVASREYFNRMGSSPMSISDLVGFCAANPGSCSLDPRLESGETGGYVYMVVGGSLADGSYQIAAEPEFPGITGSLTIIIDLDFSVMRSSTPGADQARQRAFDNILASGARKVVNLLALDPASTSQARSYTGTVLVNNGYLSTVDTSGDGNASIEELFVDGPARFTNTVFDDQALKQRVDAFLDDVYRELKLDRLSEADSRAVTVATGDIDNDSALLFSYEGLRNLTSILAQDGTSNTILNSMLSKLDAAEAAEARGNENKKAQRLAEYRNRVRAQIGSSLTRVNANTLTKLSECL